MSNTIHAVYENGAFRPTSPVDLPEHCCVELEVRAVDANASPTGGDISADASPRTGWDAFFATKLVIGSAPADQDEDEREMTGDDLLF
jgi:predicted DNA-binding antitoxin AbrB/MazE fold protein